MCARFYVRQIESITITKETSLMIERNSLELAADFTSRSETLPAIATCTWCESAAEVMCVARSRCVAVVRFVDRNCNAPLGPPWPGVGVSSRPENQPLTEAVREAAAQSHGEIGASPDLGDLDPCDDCMVTAMTLDPHALAQDPVLSMLACIDGRSALLASTAIDPQRGVRLRIVIAESAASDDAPFTDADAEALRAAMRRIAQRARLAFASAPGVVTEPLNIREVEVLESLARGKTIRQIAAEMHRSTHTVHDYLKSMHRKVGVGCRAELIARAAGRCGPRTTATQLASELVA